MRNLYEGIDIYMSGVATENHYRGHAWTT